MNAQATLMAAIKCATIPLEAMSVAASQVMYYWKILAPVRRVSDLFTLIFAPVILSITRCTVQKDCN